MEQESSEVKVGARQKGGKGGGGASEGLWGGQGEVELWESAAVKLGGRWRGRRAMQLQKEAFEAWGGLLGGRAFGDGAGQR